MYSTNKYMNSTNKMYTSSSNKSTTVSTQSVTDLTLVSNTVSGKIRDRSVFRTSLP